MQQGASLKEHIAEFITIINDLKNINIKVEDQDQGLLLLCGKANLLSKDKLDNELNSTNGMSWCLEVESKARET